MEKAKIRASQCLKTYKSSPVCEQVVASLLTSFRHAALVVLGPSLFACIRFINCMLVFQYSCNVIQLCFIFYKYKRQKVRVSTQRRLKSCPKISLYRHRCSKRTQISGQGTIVSGRIRYVETPKMIIRLATRKRSLNSVLPVC